MAFQGNKFIFDGIPSEQYGLMLANINNANQDAGKIGGTWKVHEDRIARRSVGLDYGVTANDPLSFPITMVAMEDNRHFDRNDIATVAGWLTGHQSFKKLVILQDDMGDVYYKCRITKLDAVEVGMRVVGFTATVTCDSPYAYRSTEPQLITGSSKGTTSVCFNPSNVNDYFYPTLALTDVTGDISIANEDDGGRTLKLVGLPTFFTSEKRTVNGAIIRVDDVHSLEHAVQVRASSKNLCNNADYGFINGAQTGFVAAKTDTGYSLTGSHTGSCFIILPVGSLAELGGETITKSYLIKGNGRIEYVICASDYSNRITLYGSDTTIVPQASEYPDGYILALRLYGDLNGDPAAVVTYDNIQVELGTTATAYTPYIPDLTAVKVMAQGKNLLNVQTSGVYHTNDTSPLVAITVTETGMRLEALRENSGPAWNRYGFCLGTIKEWAGKTITLFGKYFSTMTTSGTRLYGTIIGTNVEPAVAGRGGYVGKTGATEVFAAGSSSPATYTVTGEEDYQYIGVLFYFVVGDPVAVGDVVEISDIQVEIGDTATEYEPCIGPGAYPVNKDGFCEVTSIAPTMTLWTNNPSVALRCEYHSNLDVKPLDIMIDCAHQVMTASDGVNLYEYWNTDTPKYFPRLVRGNNRLTLTGGCQLEICGDVPWNIGN